MDEIEDRYDELVARCRVVLERYDRNVGTVSPELLWAMEHLRAAVGEA